MNLLTPRRDAAPSACRFSVAIPVLNGGARLLTLLDAVHTQDVGPIDVVVADSGSTDGAVDEAMRRWPTLRVFDVAPGRFDHGLVRAALVERARGERVALFSQDAVPLGSGYLAALAAPLEDPSVWGSMARQVPRPGADAGVVATLKRWTPAGPTEVRGPDHPSEPWVRARFDNVGSMVVRARALELPFPSRPFGEDLAWGAAVLEAGGSLAYVPAAVVEHHHDAGLRQTFERHRVAHRQVAREFGEIAVPTLAAAGRAWLAGCVGDLRDGGPVWGVRGGPRRAAALLGQWAGAKGVDR